MAEVESPNSIQTSLTTVAAFSELIPDANFQMDAIRKSYFYKNYELNEAFKLVSMENICSSFEQETDGQKFRMVFFLVGEEDEANSIAKNGFDCNKRYNMHKEYAILGHETEGLHFFNNMDLLFKYCERRRKENVIIISARLEVSFQMGELIEF
jgi:hypothetical protein